MSLKARLLSRIRAEGPIDVAAFMQACLHDPDEGYYAARPALGEAGDFITAPLVSQMFGELIGAWCVEVWRGLGSPAEVRLVEVGPGDGTLMSDVLRVVQRAPDVLRAARLHLVETSQPLIARQRKRLAQAPLEPAWVETLADVPTDAPMILVANEVLDCLPVRQFVRTPRGWAERLVGDDGDDGLAFGLGAPGADLAIPAPVGSVLEVAEAQAEFAATVAERLARTGGAALLIDYGRAEPGFGDTLQALFRHRKVDPLAFPGSSDLTVHADFPAVIAAARAQGAATSLASQRDFLLRLGLAERAAILSRARPDQAQIIARQLERLIGPEQMGELFKAVCLYHSVMPAPPGF